jgi:hypothetical protein
MHIVQHSYESVLKMTIQNFNYNTSLSPFIYYIDATFSLNFCLVDSAASENFKFA